MIPCSLKYILNESKASKIRQVYEALKDDTRMGNFVSLVSQDLKELKITMSEEAIKNCSKGQWKNIVKRQVKTAAFSYLKNESSEKDKTKNIEIDSLRLSGYLFHNLSTPLSKAIYSVRSGTLNI